MGKNIKIDQIENQIGQRIRELRIKRGLTQFQLATLIGTTQAQIARYESGGQDPTSRRISEIAKVLEVHEGYLFREFREEGEIKMGMDKCGFCKNMAMRLVPSMMDGFDMAEHYCTLGKGNENPCDKYEKKEP
jgi:DNA-binding XRE family transcriptional regulator